MKRFFIALVMMALASAALAQVDVGTASTAAALNQGNSLVNNFTSPAYQETTMDRFAKAMSPTAPANFGNVNGCMGVTGWSASFVANGSRTQLEDGPTCFKLAFSDRLVQLPVDPQGNIVMSQRAKFLIATGCSVEYLRPVVVQTGLACPN